MALLPTLCNFYHANSWAKESLEYRLKEAIKGDLTYQDFLLLVLEDETLYRANRRSEMLKRRAKLKDRATLEEFEADPKRGVPKSMVKQLQTLQFMAGFENLVMFGGAGAGKSYLAQAIGNAACQSGREVMFILMNYLFSQIKAAEKARTDLFFLKRLGEVGLLILDDFGLRAYPHHEATILYQILEDRYQSGSKIITTKVRPLGWKDLLKTQSSQNQSLIGSCHRLIRLNLKVRAIVETTGLRNFLLKM